MISGPNFEPVDVDGMKVVPFTTTMRTVEKLFKARPVPSAELVNAKENVVGQLVQWLAAKTSGTKSVAWRVAPELVWCERHGEAGAVVEVKLYVRAAFVSRPRGGKNLILGTKNEHDRHGSAGGSEPHRGKGAPLSAEHDASRFFGAHHV